MKDFDNIKNLHMFNLVMQIIYMVEQCRISFQ